MTITSSWSDFVARVSAQFPETNKRLLTAREGDIGALVQHLSQTHDLTFAEAAEVVAFRLPHYVEPERLSA